ncbi:MAG: transposase [Micrococcales bacterium]|nr:transposase [Micrococcales bacterium]
MELAQRDLHHDVRTDNAGKLEVAVPQGLGGTFEPATVTRHQRRLNAVDAIVLSRYESVCGGLSLVDPSACPSPLGHEQSARRGADLSRDGFPTAGVHLMGAGRRPLR